MVCSISMVPLIWISLRRGAKMGLFTCFIYGLVQFALEPYAYHPIQVLLDYPLAFGVLGLSGFFGSYPLIGVGFGIGGDSLHIFDQESYSLLSTH